MATHEKTSSRSPVTVTQKNSILNYAGIVFLFIFPTLIPKRFCHVLKYRALFCFPHSYPPFYYFFLFHPQEPLDF